ncbi:MULTISPECIES: ribose-5-phosphate isomerase RpiA [Bartonella]|uniref:ribose-5-phosphate isomerase RpiA n=1 Tax=Bartonella TaxID=773 RepID=UPI0018DEBF2D|nr:MULTISPECIES: ribose-5-phosphate isomerase RpiA [Bartonella]MBH9994482.1 ribose-5-phosphate isomerase RpiA [Bartonella sp. P0291]MBH9997173.1 ribose-5-phosphate isomerase RpiA [Bartonella sp. M0192]MBH9999333.1 ribose-5-phosphate isomerase RpiA [Bartonella sp. M0191]MBI0007185.1 ribose-5-phosphate isomerase RpiA [Bartonella sp. M0193]MBI0010624.1 ribose-5-phosphate isomerase RpiA [Bartonella sp. M0176]
MDSLQLKKAAAAKAVEFVEDGMKLGIGTGSTANEFIRLLARRVKEGLKVTGVATSERSEQLCRELGIPVASLDEMPSLDLDIDGADEIGPKMALVKGGGGALLREKIVAFASARMLVIADQSKLVKTLGAFPLPIEVNPFGLQATKLAIVDVAKSLGLSGNISLRVKNNKTFVTDGGHFILDASFSRISDPESLSNALFSIPGVVEHGLFLNLANKSVVAMANGEIKVLEESDF